MSRSFTPINMLKMVLQKLMMVMLMVVGTLYSTRSLGAQTWMMWMMGKEQLEFEVKVSAPVEVLPRTWL